MEELPQSTTSFMTEGTGRRRVTRLLRLLGDPQDDLRVIHVAGTAGKGSVSAFLAAVLHAHGFRVGAYLSPHVHSILERFWLDGAPPPVEDFAVALEFVRAQTDSLVREEVGAPTMFEAATAAAFMFFREQKVDYAVIETGLGGLHDATNTVTRSDKLAVITAIGLDHTAVLGDTIPQIAVQKAGILPRGGTGVAVRSGADADEAVVLEAARLGCELDHLTPSHAADEIPAHVPLGLAGEHQRVNAGLAVRAARRLAARDGWLLDPDSVAAGLARTRLPGRFEQHGWQGRQVVLDGAHNPLKLRSVVSAVQRQWPGLKPVWVVAFKQDKNVADAMRLIVPAASAVIAAEFDSAGRNHGRGHAVPAADVAAAARLAGAGRVATAARFETALKEAARMSGPGTPIVVSGSFYAVADAGAVMTA